MNTLQTPPIYFWLCLHSKAGPGDIHGFWVVSIGAIGSDEMFARCARRCTCRGFRRSASCSSPRLRVFRFYPNREGWLQVVLGICKRMFGLELFGRRSGFVPLDPQKVKPSAGCLGLNTFWRGRFSCSDSLHLFSQPTQQVNGFQLVPKDIHASRTMHPFGTSCGCPDCKYCK